MLKRSLRRTLGAAAVAAALVLGSTAAAHATPAPDNGPVAGGTTVMVPEPAGVTFTSISNGQYHSVALGSDGNAYAWGDNFYGQLGDGTNTNRNTPVQVQAPAGVTFTSISSGGYHSVAWGSDGNAYAWGYNVFGQLGDGTNTNSNTPVQVLGDVVVTRITFDGVEGTNLVDNGDGTWSVDTPAHAEGAVDVVVSYTWNNIAQTPVTYTGGYTYTPNPVAPTITNPTDQSVTDGDTATFTVTTTGIPTPTVTWEVSRDGGTTWETITADPAATPAADGLTLSVVGTSANDGYQYRATATSSAGVATSQIAKLTVTPKAGTDTPKNEKDKNVSTELAFTGSEATPAFLSAALVALLLGAGLVTANRVAKRRLNP